MKLTYQFNLASLSMQELNALLRHLFNALASSGHDDHRRQTATKIIYIQKEIRNRVLQCLR